jgi:hypothetical protein
MARSLGELWASASPRRASSHDTSERARRVSAAGGKHVLHGCCGVTRPVTCAAMSDLRRGERGLRNLATASATDGERPAPRRVRPPGSGKRDERGGPSAVTKPIPSRPRAGSDEVQRWLRRAPMVVRASGSASTVAGGGAGERVRAAAVGEDASQLAVSCSRRCRRVRNSRPPSIDASGFFPMKKLPFLLSLGSRVDAVSS